MFPVPLLCMTYFHLLLSLFVKVFTLLKILLKVTSMFMELEEALVVLFTKIGHAMCVKGM